MTHHDHYREHAAYQELLGALCQCGYERLTMLGLWLRTTTEGRTYQGWPASHAQGNPTALAQHALADPARAAEVGEWLLDEVWRARLHPERSWINAHPMHAVPITDWVLCERYGRVAQALLALANCEPVPVPEPLPVGWWRQAAHAVG